MLIQEDENTHFCFVKRVSKLLYDQIKHSNKKHFCTIYLTGLSKAEILAEHQKHCNGERGTPTRIEMPKEGQNKLKIKNFTSR